MKRIILYLLFCFFIINLYGNPIDINEAKKVAVNFYQTITNNKTIKIKTVDISIFNNLKTYYTIIFDNEDWIIIAADDNVEPILAFSTEGSYSNNIPPACESLLNQYDEYIYYMVLNNQTDTLAKDAWIELKSNNYIPTKNSVSPLLSTKWGQSHPNDDEGNIEAYNYYMLDADDLDYIDDADCSTNCLAGCPAVAMGQILRYWERPNCPQFHWESMPEELIYHNNPNYETERNAISSFLYYLGNLIDNEMDSNYYCIVSNCASGITKIEEALPVFKNKMYCTSSEIIKKEDYKNKKWEELLTTELDYGRPIFYTGTGTGGHAFVLDGYFENWFNYKYHVNWGWCGNYNGYFRIGNLNPNGFDFSYNMQAIINIEPLNCNNELTIYDYYSSSLFLSYLYYNPIAGYIYSSPFPITIKNYENVHYRAYNEIVLENFETEEGAEFTAEIVSCPVNCDFGIPPPYAKYTNKKLYNLEENLKEDVYVSPNPAYDIINVYTNGLENSIKKIYLYNLLGQIIFQSEFTTDEFQINIENQSAGVYFINIETNNKSYFKKFIKK